MPRIEVRMPSAEGVAAGQTATFKLPIGRRYHSLQLAYSGTTMSLANMTEIRVIANGKVIQRFSATDRDAWNRFDGLAAASGILIIPFDRTGLFTLAGEEQTALNTGSVNNETGVGIKSLSVEVDINSSAVAPVLSMTATQSDAIAGGAGTVLHIKKLTYAPAGAGEYEIADLPRNSAETFAMNRMWLKPSANNITDLKIERNGYVIFERSDTLNRRMQTNGVRIPQAGYYTIDKTEQGVGGDPIDLINLADFRVKVTTDGAMTLPVHVEYLGRLGD